MKEKEEKATVKIFDNLLKYPSLRQEGLNKEIFPGNNKSIWNGRRNF